MSNKRKEQSHLDANGLDDIQRQRLKRSIKKYKTHELKTAKQFGFCIALLGGFI